jgi:type I restriction enzyme R subunit
MVWPTSILGIGFLDGPRIDGMLRAAGWILQDRVDANVDAGPGVAIREFSLGRGYGEADFLLFVDGQAAGVIEAKKEGSTIVSVKIQTQKYSEGIPDGVPAPRRLRTQLI